jgi:hypothetical protein
MSMVGSATGQDLHRIFVKLSGAAADFLIGRTDATQIGQLQQTELLTVSFSSVIIQSTPGYRTGLVPIFIIYRELHGHLAVAGLQAVSI